MVPNSTTVECRFDVRVPSFVLAGGEDVEEVSDDGELGGVPSDLVATRSPHDLRQVGIGVIPTDVAVRAVQIVLA